MYKRQPWYIQTKENDPNGVYGNFILLDAQVDNANPRNMLIDEDEDGVADFLQMAIPERADGDQKLSLIHISHSNSALRSSARSASRRMFSGALQAAAAVRLSAIRAF